MEILQKSKGKIALMATLYDRREGAIKVIQSIASQVDEVRVVANINSVEAEEFLDEWTDLLRDQSDNVVVYIRNNQLGDAERYFPIKERDVIYLSIDDDLIYPPDYVQRMTVAIEKYQSMVAMGGRFFKTYRIDSYYKERRINYYAWNGDVKEGLQIHVPLSCLTAWDAELCHVTYNMFKGKNRSDIEMARIMAEAKIPIYTVEHTNNYIQYVAPPEGTTIWDEKNQNDAPETAAMNEVLDILFQKKIEKGKISVAMIVRNEQDHIAMALESVKGFDEIIIIDTGSEDNTVEIARQYTDKVYTDYKWNDNFSEARNISIDKCSGEWIYSIDADEQLEEGGIEKVRELVASIKDSTDAVFVSNIGMKSNDTHYIIRLWKNIPAIRFEGWAHNHLEGVTKTLTRRDIKHYFGYSNAHKKDPDRTYRILWKYLSKFPEASRERFYYARELFYRDLWQDCINQLDRYFMNAYFKAEIAEANLMESICYEKLGKVKEAKEKCLTAIGINPQFKQAIWRMGDLEEDQKKKVRWREIAKTANNNDVLFIRHVGYDDAVFTYKNIEHRFRSEYPEDHIFRIQKWNKTFYELALLEKIASLQVEGTYVDVGANIGNHTVFFAKHTKAKRVLAFEIHPEIFKVLQTNIIGCDTVVPYNVGISNKTTKVRLSDIDPSNVGMTKIINESEDGVVVHSLNRLLKNERNIGLIKIDIEGYEMAALRGASDILRIYHPVLVVEARNEEKLQEIKSELSKYGYSTDGINYTATPTYIFKKD